ncbi:SPO71 Prospore membrane adapter protein SPO71 [Candida maltosa Xu316]
MSSDETKFSIPRSSYTASLLTFLTPDLLNECGKSLFIGGIPEIWHENKHDLLAEYLKQKVRDKYNESSDVIKDYIGNKDEAVFFKKREEILRNIDSNNSTSTTNTMISPDISLNTELFTPPNQQGTGNSSLVTIHDSMPKIKYEMPHPQTTVHVDEAWIEEENRKFSRRLKRFANKTTGIKTYANSKVNLEEVRHKVHNSIIKSYKIGEIIRIDKVLVMVRKSVNQFQTYEDSTTRVVERWKEFVVVIRKTDSVEEPLMLQFYDIYKSPNDSHPKFGFRINNKVSVQFHSYLDKTISLTVSKKTQYILRLNNQLNAFRWLYFLKEALGIELNTVFNLYVPCDDIFLEVIVPRHILRNYFENCNEMVITKKAYGYNIELDDLLQFFQKKIQQKCPQQSPNSWFSFRLYDRLEWARNTGELLYIQNALYSPLYRLEFRDMCSLEVAPMPIEGFLGRLTNIYGHEKSTLRNFYKISYFYTNKNLLFFTKYYRSVPPSSYDKKSLIYQQDIFPMDKCGHMQWLETNFTDHDLELCDEIERRTELIVKAEGLIDVADIIEIKVCEVTAIQKLMQCTLWYSNPELTSNDEITDSGFEIVLKNGSIIKLQAPSKAIRDCWINALSQISKYWVDKRHIHLMEHVNKRSKNTSMLGANNYVDSNAPDEIDYLESQNALPICNAMNYLLPNTLFQPFYAVLCPGFLIMYHTFKRSMVTGTWKPSAFFEHYLTIPLTECYLYSGRLSELDLLTSGTEARGSHLDKHAVPKLYPNGWRSMEEDHLLCFTLWFGKKRNLTRYEKQLPRSLELGVQTEKNPGWSP